MMQLVHPICSHIGSKIIEHASFASTCGWFHRYTNNSVRWGMDPPMPNSFNEAIRWLRKNRPNGAEHLIKFISFGCGEDYIGILTNGVIIVDKIHNRARNEWNLGIHRTLYQYNRDLYFLHWTKGNKVEIDHHMANTEIAQIVQKVIRGKGKNHRTEMMMQMIQYRACFREKQMDLNQRLLFFEN